MIVYPTKDAPKLGRKNIDAKTVIEAFDAYRNRFAPLANGIELTAETNDGKKYRSGNTRMVERDAGVESNDSAGASVDRNPASK